MSPPGPILTLEPLVEAVRAGVETVGWTLSGLQKTTSHQFEGRWAGDSTRSAYLFFHADRWDDASIDVFVDETTRGLSGNLALVLSGPPLGVLGSAAGTLSSLSAVASSCLPKDHPTPLTLRLRLPDSSAILGHAEVEVPVQAAGTVDRDRRGAVGGCRFVSRDDGVLRGAPRSRNRAQHSDGPGDAGLDSS